MSGIPISGTTTGATGAGAVGVAGASGGDLPETLGGGSITDVLGSLPTTGLGLLAMTVAAFTLLACGLALLALVRPAPSGPPRARAAAD